MLPKLSYSQYKKTVKEVAWNLKKAYRSTCLDRVDVNYKWHREALVVLAALLAEELAPSQADADDDDRDEPPPDELTWVRIPPASDGTNQPPTDAEGEPIGDRQRNRQGHPYQLRQHIEDSS